MSVQQHAIRYAEIGWRSFPIWPGKKNPLYGNNWREDASADPAKTRQWFPEGTDRNIAVTCGESFDAWDIEAPHLPKLAEWMEAQGVAFPDAPMARTGRGGIHVLTAPTGVNGNRYLYLDGTHIGELKSLGGYILVAPSVTEGPYQWLNRTPAMEVPEAPAWMLGWLDRPAGNVHRFTTKIKSVEEGMAHLATLAEAVGTCGEGKRNNYLYWAMRRAIEEGIPPRYAGDALLASGIAAGLEEHEAKATIRSAYEAEGKAA